MIKILLLVLMGFPFLITPIYADIKDAASDASDAAMYSDQAYGYANKAYDADTLEDAQTYASSAMSAAEDANRKAQIK